MNESAGRFLFAAAVMIAVPCATAATESDRREPGVIGIVFDNPALAKPVRVWTVAEPRAELFAPIARHDYSLSLRGSLTAPGEGEFEIRAEIDDGLRLRLDGAMILDAWTSDGNREGRARFRPDGAAKLELDYRHDGGHAMLRLYWRRAGEPAWIQIPATAFSHSAGDRTEVEATFAALMRAYEATVVEVANPHPKSWPTLKFIQQGARPLLRAGFPNVTGFVCDAWMYESDVDFIAARDAGHGAMEVRHRVRSRPDLAIVSTVRPGPGTVEIVARPEQTGGRDAAFMNEEAGLNLCWQLRHAAEFSSFPEPYELFARRCFVFMESGRSFLDRTARRPSRRFPADDPVNHPPWVQIYLTAWAGPDVRLDFPWAGISPDRLTATVAGMVSRDGRYLAALASGSATSISQVWVDCLHNNPRWTGAETDGESPVWRVKLYLMENDPAALLRHFVDDFPEARNQPGVRAIWSSATPSSR